MDEFRTAFDSIGVRYSSKSAYNNAARKFLQSPSDWTEQYYCSYNDKRSGLTYYFRNHSIVDSALDSLVNIKSKTDKKSAKSQSTVNRECPSTEIGNAHLQKLGMPISSIYKETEINSENTNSENTQSTVCEKPNQESNIPIRMEQTGLSGIPIGDEWEISVVDSYSEANESRQHQDTNGQGNIQDQTHFLDEDPNPNIAPPSAAPPNIPQAEENTGVIGGELVVLIPTPKSSTHPYDLTNEEVPERVKKMVEGLSKVKDKGKFPRELQEYAKYEIGDIVWKYRKSGLILYDGIGSSKDISDEFASSIMGGSIDTIAAAKSRILKCERDPNEWGTIRGWVLEFDCKKANTSTKQAKRDFDRQKENATNSLFDLLHKKN